MIYTIDRVQIINDKLIFFEFLSEKEDSNTVFVREKVNRLQRIASQSGINEIYEILYAENFMRDGHYVTFKSLLADKSDKYSWEQYKTKFNELNGTPQTPSKKLGSATDNEGDPYVAKLLKEIHNIDFSDDDNGLKITKAALGNNPTYGFDFDLFDDECKCIIEFLKRDSNYVSNLTSHPMRYLKNKQKFISLYKASRILESSLYLINYSENLQEPISLIEVLNYNVNTGHFVEDVSYKFNNREHLVRWLRLMNSDVPKAREFLTTLPKEYRSSEFWAKYLKDKKSVKIGTNLK